MQILYQIKTQVSIFSPNSATFSAFNEFKVYQERFQFTFFYLSSSNEKERSSSSLATHVESFWALYNPQHKNKSISAKNNLQQQWNLFWQHREMHVIQQNVKNIWIKFKYE